MDGLGELKAYLYIHILLDMVYLPGIEIKIR
jgi:hypothetical protein